MVSNWPQELHKSKEEEEEMAFVHLKISVVNTSAMAIINRIDQLLKV